MNHDDTDREHPIDLPLDSFSGPAARMSRRQADELVARVLDEASLPPHLASRRASRGALVAGAVAIAATSAAAALYVRERPAPDPVPAVASAPPSPGRAPPPAVRLEDLPAPEVEPSAPPRAPATPAAAPKTPEDWLDRANDLRAKGRFVEAERAYARVYEQYPGTGAAYVARVAGASLRLDHLGDASGARRLFEAALRGAPGGALDLEIRQGVARAAARLGDRAAERSALEALVRAHPGSKAAERARERLANP